MHWFFSNIGSASNFHNFCIKNISKWINLALCMWFWMSQFFENYLSKHKFLLSKILYPSLILRVRSWCISQCHESQDSSSGSRSLMSFLVALCTWTLPSKTQGDHYRSFSNIEERLLWKTEIRISIVYGWIEDQWCPPSKDHLPKIRDQYFMAPFFRALSHYNMGRK